MNALEFYLLDDPNPTEAMNLLQQNNIISDNCVLAADVAEPDCDRAIEFLKKHSKYDI